MRYLLGSIKNKFPFRMSSSSPVLSNRVESFGSQSDDPSYLATVQSIQSLSPTVKQFYLSIHDPQKTFRFQSGMFLDFYFPSTITSIVTGFSICNSPLNYAQTHSIELAIKETNYPPTDHMFNRCQVNDEVHVKPGGEFFYDSSLTKNDSILLLCAGIGANPIVSILRHLSDLYQTKNFDRIPSRIAFFYTAAREEDLVFRSSIDVSCQQLIKENLLRTNYFVTKEIHTDSKINYRRMNPTDLQHAIHWLDKPVTTYLCGPSSFLTSMETLLKELNVKNIFYEKWW